MAVENVWSGLYVPLLGVLLLCQLALWAVLYQVVKQQGRILLRLDEERLLFRALTVALVALFILAGIAAGWALVKKPGVPVYS